ncbi:MAG: hypothetical protein IPL06_17310 [Betaproteobacteria bacterium]|nr:hypothetical protein [Betaproteobacteria bacterium]
MTPTPIALLVSSLFLSAHALADAPAADPPGVVVLHDIHTHLAQAETGKATAEAWRAWGDDLRASLSSMYGDRFMGAKRVSGAPYSADVSTENNQPLPDGNVISKKTTGRVFRDNEGRTRQETLVGGVAKSIQIADPVEKKSVMLLPGSKKAVNMPFAIHGKDDRRELQVFKSGGREIRIENGKVSVDGKETTGTVELVSGNKTIRVENGRVTIDGKELKAPVPPVPPVPSATPTGSQSVVETETKDGVRRETVRVQVVSSSHEGAPADFTWNLAPLPPLPPTPPVPPGGSVSSRSKATTSSLGQKEFDGVRAEGTMRQQVIPAGEIGNRNPITVTTESWYSPELQVTVYSRHNDPRRGETIYRLSNIRRAEPAADLFKVPEEYATRKSATPAAPRSPG